MPQPQLSIRSARAKTLAHRLAKKERRSVSQVVESALENYARTQPEAQHVAGKGFWERLASEGRVEGEPDIDLDALIRENRVPHKPVEL